MDLKGQTSQINPTKLNLITPSFAKDYLTFRKAPLFFLNFLCKQRGVYQVDEYEQIPQPGLYPGLFFRGGGTQKLQTPSKRVCIYFVTFLRVRQTFWVGYGKNSFCRTTKYFHPRMFISKDICFYFSNIAGDQMYLTNFKSIPPFVINRIGMSAI